MSATRAERRSDRWRDLRFRYRRHVGLVVLGLLVLFVAHNVAFTIWNQRELPLRKSTEIAEWLHVSPRQIETVALEHPSKLVYGLIGIWYFLGNRIAGAQLVIPEWMAWSRWELERVSGLEIEIVDRHLIVGKRDAGKLRRVGEERIYTKGGRRNRRLVSLYLIHDPAARRYVVAERSGDIFVLPEKQYTALRDAETELP